MSPTDDLPPPLDDLSKYKFWYQDERKQPRTCWFPDVDATDREYGRLQQDLARDLAARLHKEHGIGALVLLSALPDKTGLKSSDITRDLGDKLQLCSAVLIVYKDGPAYQIHPRSPNF